MINSIDTSKTITLKTDEANVIPSDGIVQISGSTSTTLWGNFSLSINGYRMFQIQNTGTSSINYFNSFRVNKGDIVNVSASNGGTIEGLVFYPL